MRCSGVHSAAWRCWPSDSSSSVSTATRGRPRPLRRRIRPGPRVTARRAPAGCRRGDERRAHGPGGSTARSCTTAGTGRRLVTDPSTDSGRRHDGWADAAETAVTGRHLRRLWALPGHGAGGGRLAADPGRAALRPLALLVAGAAAGLLGGRAAPRSVGHPTRADPTARPGHPTAQRPALAQRVFRRHGLAGFGIAAGSAGRRRFARGPGRAHWPDGSPTPGRPSRVASRGAGATCTAIRRPTARRRSCWRAPEI